MNSEYSLRFPLGESPFPEHFNTKEIETHIQEISLLPGNVAELIKPLDRVKLKNNYRPAGWTGLQVLHHITDSHLNAFCRLKLALTESNPTIKPYEEQAWAELIDYDENMLETNLILLQALHKKWVYLMQSLTEAQWRRTFYHPGNQKVTSLYQHVAIYAWHGKHHLEHFKLAISK